MLSQQWLPSPLLCLWSGSKHNFSLGLHGWMDHWLFNDAVVTVEATTIISGNIQDQKERPSGLFQSVILTFSWKK
jgi:hypothetical protein